MLSLQIDLVLDPETGSRWPGHPVPINRSKIWNLRFQLSNSRFTIEKSTDILVWVFAGQNSTNWWFPNWIDEIATSLKGFDWWWSLKWKTKTYENLCIGWISRNFKILILKPKLSFLEENYKNDNKGEFLDQREFTQNRILKKFHENGQFKQNRKNHIKGEFVKIREFILVIKMKVFKCLGIQPNLCTF